MKKILVTGASGFIGQNVGRWLGPKYELTALVRKKSPQLVGYRHIHVLPDLAELSQFEKLFAGYDAIIHLAALAHVDERKKSHEDYERNNVMVTRGLAEACSKNKVSRFIFLSTAIVHGAGSEGSITENSPLNPETEYSKSKVKAEEILMAYRERGLRPACLRVPRVYGPGVKENFLRLLKWVGWGIPLPFRGVTGQRSFLYSGNLCSAIEFLLQNEDETGPFLVADSETFSIGELLQQMARAFGKKGARLFWFPQALVKCMFRLMGKENLYHRLTDRFVVSSGRLQKLGWRPSHTFSEGIYETVFWFRQRR